MSGRARDNRLVHVAVADDPALRPRPGDLGEVIVTHAAPHHLNADAPDGGSALLSLRRTRGGDAWEARQRAEAESPAAPVASAVSLGMPGIGAPQPLPAAPACSH
jgi:tRNA-2-methylthio-N6-dimethylallyladenosine synthase